MKDKTVEYMLEALYDGGLRIAACYDVSTGFKVVFLDFKGFDHSFEGRNLQDTVKKAYDYCGRPSNTEGVDEGTNTIDLGVLFDSSIQNL